MKAGPSADPATAVVKPPTPCRHPTTPAGDASPTESFRISKRCIHVLPHTRALVVAEDFTVPDAESTDAGRTACADAVPAALAQSEPHILTVERLLTPVRNPDSREWLRRRCILITQRVAHVTSCVTTRHPSGTRHWPDESNDSLKASCDIARRTLFSFALHGGDPKVTGKARAYVDASENGRDLVASVRIPPSPRKPSKMARRPDTSPRPQSRPRRCDERGMAFDITVRIAKLCRRSGSILKVPFRPYQRNLRVLPPCRNRLPTNPPISMRRRGLTAPLGGPCSGTQPLALLQRRLPHRRLPRRPVKPDGQLKIWFRSVREPNPATRLSSNEPPMTTPAASANTEADWPTRFAI